MDINGFSELFSKANKMRISRDSGIDASTIYRFLTNKSRTYFDTIEKIAAAMGYDVVFIKRN